MTIVDTSIWIDHIHTSDDRLTDMLAQGEALMHPFVIGEIVLGHLRDRVTTLRWLHRLPPAAAATPGELLRFIEAHALHGRGIGYVDAHLLASARLHEATVWTGDRRLLAAASDLGLAFTRLQ